MRIGLISDTHGKLRPAVLEVFEGVDAIIHAGDIGGLDIITELTTLATVHAVHGNTDDFDIRAEYGEALRLDLGGVAFVVVHGHLLGSPTPARLRAEHPNCDVIIYGHTHVPLVDEQARPLVINPGAAGPARFNLKPSVAILELPRMTIQQIPLT